MLAHKCQSRQCACSLAAAGARPPAGRTFCPWLMLLQFKRARINPALFKRPPSAGKAREEAERKYNREAERASLLAKRVEQTMQKVCLFMLTGRLICTALPATPGSHVQMQMHVTAFLLFLLGSCLHPKHVVMLITLQTCTLDWHAARYVGGLLFSPFCRGPAS